MVIDPAERDGGFTLVEVLVALVILAVASGFAFQAFSGSFAWLSEAENEQKAIVAARSLISRLGHDLPVHPGHSMGSDGTLHWTVDIDNAMDSPTPAANFAAYPIVVTIQWPEHASTRKFRLQTVRIGRWESPK